MAAYYNDCDPLLNGQIKKYDQVMWGISHPSSTVINANWRDTDYPSKHVTLTQRWFTVGPTSQTVGQQ